MDPFSALFNLIAMPANIFQAWNEFDTHSKYIGSQQQALTKRSDNNVKELERSAKLEEGNAVDALARGSLLAGRTRMKGSQIVGQQQLAYANSGVDSTVGTPAQVASSTAALTELEAMTAENNAARSAWGHREVASKYRRQQKYVRDEQRAEAMKLNHQYQAGASRMNASLLGSVVNLGGGGHQ